MIQRLQTIALFGLYQASVALGIMMLPLAVLAQRAGITLPVHRLVKRVDDAYQTHR